MSKETRVQEFTFDDVLLIPGKSNVELAEEGIIDTTSSLTKKIKLKNPIISANMATVTESDMAITMAKMGGLGVIHQFMDNETQLDEVKKVKKGGYMVGAAVFSYGSKILDHTVNLQKAGCDIIFVDSANAHNKQAIELISKIKNKLKIEVVAGNIATSEAVRDLAACGVDGIKVGIGPGSHCTTRLITGFGRPQLSTIEECVKAAKRYNIPIIADGGIKTPGDAVKAIAFGADSVMVGGMLAGTDESPGKLVRKNGKLFKESWGNCTNNAYRWTFSKENIKSQIKMIIKKYLLDDKDKLYSTFVEEGVTGLVEYNGSAEKVFTEISGGIRRGIWYGGGVGIKDFQKKVRYVLISNSTAEENRARILNGF